MKILLPLIYSTVLLFAAYFWHHLGMQWLLATGYDLALNEPLAKSLNYSIDLYLELIAMTSLGYLFFALFQRFYHLFALLLWIAKIRVFGKYWTSHEKIS